MYGRMANATASRESVGRGSRSEEHTSELRSFRRISYAVFCLNKNNSKPAVLWRLPLLLVLFCCLLAHPARARGFFFLAIPPPPTSTRTDTLFPYTTRFR